MTTSMTRTLLAVALASAIGGFSAGPALGDQRGWGHEQRNRAQYERDRRADRRDNWREDRRRYGYRPVSAPPVYAPPPVVYVPAPSHGISIFFPLFR